MKLSVRVTVAETMFDWVGPTAKGFAAVRMSRLREVCADELMLILMSMVGALVGALPVLLDVGAAVNATVGLSVELIGRFPRGFFSTVELSVGPSVALAVGLSVGST